MMANPGKSPVRIRSRISLADAALMRLEAKRAKGQSGTLVPEDMPPPTAEASSETSEASPKTPVPAKPETRAASPKDEVAARLEAALKGHLESVASALAASRPAPRAGVTGRSVYAPGSPATADSDDRRDDESLRLPPATPFAMEPLPPPPALAEPLATTEEPEYPDYVEYEDEPHDEEEGEEFGHAPLSWMNGDDAEEEHDPLPAALLRQSRPEAEPVAHLPPLVEATQGISARTLAVAALFGLAAGVGAIAAYQFSVAPVATPAVAVAPTRPAADATRIVKLDADRVPQGDEAPGIKVASATAVPKLAPAAPASPAVAALDVAPAVPAPAPLVPEKPAVETAAADPAPALRPTEDAGTAAATAAEDNPDTEPFVATAAVRPAQPKRPASDGQVLAYAPTPQPNDPVGRSFFGKEDDGAAAQKKSASAKTAAPSPGKAKVLMSVNMRAKPDNDAPSVKILGAGARVQVVQCDMWCLVVANGKRGYIFKRFLDN
jgi:hypothetical protein